MFWFLTVLMQLDQNHLGFDVSFFCLISQHVLAELAVIKLRLRSLLFDCDLLDTSRCFIEVMLHHAFVSNHVWFICNMQWMKHAEESDKKENSRVLKHTLHSWWWPVRPKHVVKQSTKKKHRNLADFGWVSQWRIRTGTIFTFIHSATGCWNVIFSRISLVSPTCTLRYGLVSQQTPSQTYISQYLYSGLSKSRYVLSCYLWSQ
jgi:hypothetical protein